MFNLEAAIKKAIADSVDGLAREIGRAVRKGLAKELAGAMLAGPAPQPKPAAPEARERARPAGAPKGRPNAIKPSELQAVLQVIKSRPHLTSVQIQKVAGIDAKQALRVMKKLRKTGAVKVKGRRSVATYTLA
jgi:CRP-like cAMP-binding protein